MERARGQNAQTSPSLPGGSDGKESACNAGDLGSIPGSGISPGEGNNYPFQYSCLENPMDRGAWWATVHGVTKSWTEWLKFFTLSSFCLLPGPPGKSQKAKELLKRPKGQSAQAESKVGKGDSGTEGTKETQHFFKKYIFNFKKICIFLLFHDLFSIQNDPKPILFFSLFRCLSFYFYTIFKSYFPFTVITKYRLYSSAVQHILKPIYTQWFVPPISPISVMSFLSSHW